jgi:dipeptidyl aminopeptidase/acylaminoacyl peptidase
MFKPLLNRVTLCAALFALVITSSLISTAQQSPVRARIDEVMKGARGAHYIGAVSVSPDGRFVEWVEGQGKIRIVLRNSEGELGLTKEDKGRVIDAGDECNANSIIWSPDSKRIAFLAPCDKNPQQNLFVASIDGDSKPHRITDLKGFVEAPAFSPDGKHIAFLYVEGATRPSGALAAMKPPSGVIGEDGVEIQRVAIARADVDKPEAVQLVTPEKLHVYEFDWRHDGAAIAFIAAEPPGENNWWVAKLYSEELADLSKTPATPQVILTPAEVAGALHGLQIAVPRWSPDGRSIAFIGGLMSDQGSTGGDVWIISAKGGEPRDLTVGSPTSPAWIEWGDNEHIFVNEESAGNQQLISLHFSNTPGQLVSDFGVSVFSIPASIGDGRMKMSLSSTSDHSFFIFTASSYEHAPEIYGVSTLFGSNGYHVLQQLTHFNDAITPAWGKVDSLHWKNEGFSVQGWLIEPKGYDPARDANKKFPMIVIVHGGPSASAESRWGMGGGLSGTLFSALGYFVLEANPRGSFGQGEAFTKANIKDFGYGDLRDILAGVDTVLAKFPVDDKRIGLTGWSYGGFMTMFGITQTQRFRAAVVGAGIANWQSYYGENSIDQWMIPFFGASVYDDPAVYAKSSAITFIHQIHTPTLVIVGDRDGECPAPQSYEFWHALRDQHVKTQLVIYPNEGHAFADPEHRRDVLTRAVEWFETEMTP